MLDPILQPSRKIEEEVPNLGAFHLVYGRVDQALPMLDGMRIARARDVAEGRASFGDLDTQLSYNWSFTAEGVLYIPGKRECYFVANSPLLAAAVQVCSLYDNGSEMYFAPEDIIELARCDAKLDPEERSVFCHTIQGEVESFGTLNFAENPLMRWIWGQKAGEYGRLLDDNGIRSVEFYTTSLPSLARAPLPFFRQLWIGCTDARSPIMSNVTFSRLDRWRGIDTAA